MTCTYTGAYVALPDYGVFGPADIHAINGSHVRLVKFNGDVVEKGVRMPEREVTHVLYLNRGDNVWPSSHEFAMVALDDLEPTKFARKDQL